MKYVILMGNPADGFVIIGPFDDAAFAAEYINTDPAGKDMWVCEMHEPDLLPEEVT